MKPAQQQSSTQDWNMQHPQWSRATVWAAHVAACTFETDLRAPPGSRRCAGCAAYISDAKKNCRCSRCKQVVCRSYKFYQTSAVSGRYIFVADLGVFLQQSLPAGRSTRAQTLLLSQRAKPRCRCTCKGTCQIHQSFTRSNRH